MIENSVTSTRALLEDPLCCLEFLKSQGVAADDGGSMPCWRVLFVVAVSMIRFWMSL